MLTNFIINEQYGQNYAADPNELSVKYMDEND